MQSVQILHGKKKTRGELRLPQLHFVAMDQWEKEIGWKAIRGWLKLYTLADRKNFDCDLIPNSMENIRKILEVGGSTFYPQIIKPLWNYGFIDLQEITVNNNILVNIIVYEYPCNDPSKATLPLEKIRDYDTDYHSTNREHAINNAKKRMNKLPSTDMVEPLPSTEWVEPPLPNGESPSTDTVDINVLNTNNVLNTDNEMNISQSVIDSESVKMTISQNQKLMDRLTDIEKIYLSVKDHKAYSDTLFIYTLDKVGQARIRSSFSRYLIKAMMNNLNEYIQQFASGERVPKDKLPEWIQRQLESKHEESAVIVDREISEQEKQEINELLRALGEIK